MRKIVATLVVLAGPGGVLAPAEAAKHLPSPPEGSSPLCFDVVAAKPNDTTFQAYRINRCTGETWAWRGVGEWERISDKTDPPSAAAPVDPKKP